MFLSCSSATSRKVSNLPSIRLFTLEVSKGWDEVSIKLDFAPPLLASTSLTKVVTCRPRSEAC